MGYENDPFMDEDGEPLMDPDIQSDREPSFDPQFPLDDDDKEDWRRNRSSTPAIDEDKARKPRKRLIKKAGKEATPSPVRSESAGNIGLEDWEDDAGAEEVGSNNKWKEFESMKAGSLKSEKKEKVKRKKKVERGGERGGKGRGASGSKGRDEGVDPEMKELWDKIAGQSEVGYARSIWAC